MNKDLEDVVSDLALDKRNTLLHQLALLDEKFSIGEADMQPLLDALTGYEGELAADCYASGFNDGAMVGMERGKQKGAEDAAERMAMAVMPDSGILN